MNSAMQNHPPRTVYMQGLPLLVYLCQLGLILCRQTGADFFSPCTASPLHLDLPVFLDQRLPAEPHLLLQLQVVVLSCYLSRTCLAGNHKTMKIFTRK